MHGVAGKRESYLKCMLDTVQFGHRSNFITTVFIIGICGDGRGFEAMKFIGTIFIVINNN